MKRSKWRVDVSSNLQLDRGHSFRPNENPFDKHLGSDRLRTIAAANQHAEMGIARDDEIRIRGDGTVGKLVVVPISGNGAEEKGWRDLDDVFKVSRGEFQQPFQGLPPRDPGCPDDHLAILRKECRWKPPMRNAPHTKRRE